MFREIDARELEYRLEVIEHRLGINRTGLPSNGSHTPDLLRRIEKIEFELNIEAGYPENLEDVLVTLQDRTLQQIFREVDAQDLALALLGMKQKTLMCVKSNFSHKAWSMMCDEVALVLRREVTNREIKMAKAKLLNVMHLLESMGEIILRKTGDDEKSRVSLQERAQKHQQETKEKEENGKRLEAWKKEVFDPLAQNA